MEVRGGEGRAICGSLLSYSYFFPSYLSDFSFVQAKISVQHNMKSQGEIKLQENQSLKVIKAMKIILRQKKNPRFEITKQTNPNKQTKYLCISFCSN